MSSVATVQLDPVIGIAISSGLEIVTLVAMLVKSMINAFVKYPFATCQC